MLILRLWFSIIVLILHFIRTVFCFIFIFLDCGFLCLSWYWILSELFLYFILLFRLRFLYLSLCCMISGLSCFVFPGHCDVLYLSWRCVFPLMFYLCLGAVVISGLSCFVFSWHCDALYLFLDVLLSTDVLFLSWCVFCFCISPDTCFLFCFCFLLFFLFNINIVCTLWCSIFTYIMYNIRLSLALHNVLLAFWGFVSPYTVVFYSFLYFV